MAHRVETTLAARPYAVGDTFTAADVSLATAVHWRLNVMPLLPDTAILRAYLERVQTRPRFQSFMAKGQEGL